MIGRPRARVFAGVVTVPLFVLWAIQVEACPAGFRSGKLRNTSHVAELYRKTLPPAKRRFCGTFLATLLSARVRVAFERRRRPLLLRVEVY